MVTSSQYLESSQGSLEERFAHLLQPIRDLAKNWDVDIAQYLEEYLGDLEKIEISFNDGAITMNFSEAALLIQGSAGVYAKKVEYLHSLVYQVLDLITQKKKQKTAEGENGEEGGEGDVNDGIDEQFLLLDDMPDEGGSYFAEKDASTLKSVQAVPEMPSRLIPLEESEKGDDSLYNKKGEIMGNHCDFNVDTGYISSDGSLLLETGDRNFLGVLSKHRQTLLPLEEEEERHGLFNPDPVTVPCDGDDYIGGDDFDGDGCGGIPDNDVDMGDNAEQENIRKSSRKRVTFARTAPKQKPAVDLWELADPYDKGKSQEKPPKKKKPFKLPPCLEEKPKKRKRTGKEIKQELPPIHEVVEKLFSHRPKFPKNPLKVPDFPELEDAFWREYKLRGEIKKEEIKHMKNEEKREMEEIVKEELEAANDEEVDLPRQFEDDNDDDDQDLPQLHLDADLFSDRNSIGIRRLTDTGYLTRESDDMTMTYEDCVQKLVEKFLASAAEYAQITDLTRRVSEWEEKVRPKLEEEETHEPFDIHKYGTFIIEQLVRGEKRAFRDLVRGKLQFEVCRYTLATLQLANVYNVELCLIPDANGSTMDSLYVTLLSTKRHFEDLEEYQAPSLKES